MHTIVFQARLVSQIVVGDEDKPGGKSRFEREGERDYFNCLQLENPAEFLSFQDNQQ